MELDRDPRERSPGAVVVSEPAFGEVRAACVAHGLRVEAVPTYRQQAHAPRIGALLAAARHSGAVAVHLCNPGTPTGIGCAHAEIAAFARELAPTALVLGESFLALSDLHGDLQRPLPDNVVRVRSLTKDFGIPGVRVGYAIAPEPVAHAVARHRPSWTVGAAAQTVARCAPTQGLFMLRSRLSIREARDARSSALRRLGHPAMPSVAPYLTFSHPDAEALSQRLLRRHGIAVRHCRSFGLPDVIRLGLPSTEQQARVLDALAAEL